MKKDSPTRHALAAAASLVLAIAGAGGAAAEEATWAFGGAFSQRALALASEPAANAATDAAAGASADWIAAYGSATSLEATLRARGSNARAEASVEAAVLTGASAAAAWAQAAAALASGEGSSAQVFLAPSPRAPAEAASAPSALAAFRIRTLYVKLNTGEMSLSAGRMVVNYGRGAIWSPVDLFSELDLSGLSAVRRGSDALRATISLGALSGLDIVAAPASAPEKGKYAARLSGLLGDIDAGLIAARDGKAGAWRAGFDLKADPGAGVYLEAQTALADGAGADSALKTMADNSRIAAGLDWSLGDFFVAAEYYFNAAGAASMGAAAANPAASGSVPSAIDALFPATHYAFASLRWSLSDFVVLGASVTADLESGRGRATLSLSADLAQNAAATLYLDASNGSFAAPGVERRSIAAGLAAEIKF